MRNTIYILLATIFVLTSCVDVVDVEVPIAPPRLVIEASIDWEKGTNGAEQTVVLSKSTPYFDDPSKIDYVSGASVKVTNTDTNEEFLFVDQNDGTYTTQTFVPILNNKYVLEVIYDSETYLAEEILTPVVPIKDLYQSRENGFDKEALEVNVVFDDPANEKNYYLFKVQQQGDLLPELSDFSDEFVDGNEVTLFYEKLEDEDINQKEFQPGDVVDIKFHGISSEYFDYIRLLIEQSEPGGPFATIPVALKGNCINTTNKDNYAFGYFRVTEVDVETYTFQ